MRKQKLKIINFILPTFDDILWMTAFFGVLFLGRKMMNGDGDLGRHLTVGKYILNARKILLEDMFSHTMPGENFTPHEWLSQVIFALVEKYFDFEGIIFLCALVIASTIFLVFHNVRKESKLLLPGLLVGLLTLFTTMVHWLTRPHIFTFMFLAIWMLVLSQMRKGKHKQWWVLPILMLFWANLHGAFIAGFASWFVYGLGIAWDLLCKRTPENEIVGKYFWRHYLLGGIFSFLASLINPSGLNLWKTSVGYIGENYLVDRTVEYMSPNFHNIALWPLLIHIGLLIVLLGLSKKFISSGLLLNGAAWLLMGLYSVRNIPLYAIVTAPLVSQGLDHLLLNKKVQNKLINRLRDTDTRLMNLNKQLKGTVWPALCIVFVIVGLLMGVSFSEDGQEYAFDPEVFPVKAVDWLEENPQEGEMFNYFTWGGYLLYRLWPEKQVFIDGQTDFYGEALTREYVKVIELQDGWEDVLDEYEVDWVILPTNSAAADSIKSDLGWDILYMDNTAIILRN